MTVCGNVPTVARSNFQHSIAVHHGKWYGKQNKMHCNALPCRSGGSDLVAKINVMPRMGLTVAEIRYCSLDWYQIAIAIYQGCPLYLIGTVWANISHQTIVYLPTTARGLVVKPETRNQFEGNFPA